MFRPVFVLAASIALLSGCPSGGGGGSDGDCPIGKTARDLLEESVSEALFDGILATQHTSDVETGFSLALPGSDDVNSGFAFVIGPCTATTTFEPYCEPAGGISMFSFFESHQKCLRLGCEAADIPVADAYFTLGSHPDPEDRHPFDYLTTHPEGTGHYEQNPRRTFRTALTDSSGAMSVQIEESVTIEAGGRTIDLSHTGTLSGSRIAEDVVGFDLGLTYFSLAGAEPVVAEFHLGSGGTLARGEDVLATIPDDPGPFDWREGCR